MNIHRFMTLPNAFKPLSLIFILLVILLTISAPANTGGSLEGSWFFWLNIILQMVWFVVVCGLFLHEAEIFLSCGTDSWPIVEISYSGICAFCNIINCFILASWHKHSPKDSNTLMMAAMATFFLFIFNALGGIMMYRIWCGFIKSGATQNPTPNLQARNIGNMHPGV